MPVMVTRSASSQPRYAGRDLSWRFGKSLSSRSRSGRSVPATAPSWRDRSGGTGLLIAHPFDGLHHPQHHEEQDDDDLQPEQGDDAEVHQPAHDDPGPDHEPREPGIAIEPSRATDQRPTRRTDR